MRSAVCALGALALSLILVFPHSVLAGLNGRVVAVADGDTLTVLDGNKQQHRIRLAHIDAPEGGQPFGNRSKQLLGDLCHRKPAQVTIRDTDRFGRIVGTVICDGSDANAEMVRQGMAWVYIRYAPVGSPLFNLEADARAAKRGLWADASPVPPWEWRRGDRTAQERPVATGEVRGNRRSMIYHLSHCPSFADVSVSNRVTFGSEEKAVAAGYRRARNCQQ